MKIINKPDGLEEVQCCKCKKIFKVHLMASMNAPFVIDCNFHNPNEKTKFNDYSYSFNIMNNNSFMKQMMSMNEPRETSFIEKILHYV